MCSISYCNSKEVLDSELETNLSIAGFSYQSYSSLQELPDEYWYTAINSGDFFLQKAYLQLLETSPPTGVQPVYLLFRQHGDVVGIAYCQLVDFRATEHIRTDKSTPAALRDYLAGFMNFRLLICGNMLLTGQHGYYFHFQNKSLASELLNEALQKCLIKFRQQGDRVDAALIKDIPQADRQATQAWLAETNQQLVFQPNMVLPIAQNWDTMEDYLSDLSSKYRVRYRRARKKLAGVSCHELSSSQIRDNERDLYRLYRQVADHSAFCITSVAPNYFSELKENAPAAFRLWGYFAKGELIGFCSTIKNGTQLEAHFLGLFPEQNQAYQLYLNMLYDLIQIGIESDVEAIIFSRTAVEIKSSVGAIPEPNSVFLSHRANPLTNRIIPILVRLLEPKQSWILRHPFRQALKLAE